MASVLVVIEQRVFRLHHPGGFGRAEFFLIHGKTPIRFQMKGNQKIFQPPRADPVCGTLPGRSVGPLLVKPKQQRNTIMQFWENQRCPAGVHAAQPAPTQPVAAQNRQRPVVLLFKGIQALKRAAQFFRIVMQPLLQKVHGRRIPHIGCEHFQLGTQDFTGDKQCFHTIPNVAVKKCRAFAQCGFTGQSPKIPYKGQERAHKGSVSTAPPPQHECSPRRRGAAASFRMRLSLQEAENRFPSRKGR